MEEFEHRRDGRDRARGGRPTALAGLGEVAQRRGGTVADRSKRGAGEDDANVRRPTYYPSQSMVEVT